VRTGGSAADFATALSRPPTAPADELCVRKMRTGGSVADSFAIGRCPYGAHRDHRIHRSTRAWASLAMIIFLRC
jgi:hypothetical protein